MGVGGVSNPVPCCGLWLDDGGRQVMGGLGADTGRKVGGREAGRGGGTSGREELGVKSISLYSSPSECAVGRKRRREGERDRGR